ncbi:MAG: hypothetical protein E7507_06450 [Ruminococcus sp.]|nr:hypothetical protein [Ruminococcus sp.]
MNKNEKEKWLRPAMARFISIIIAFSTVVVAALPLFFLDYAVDNQWVLVVTYIFVGILMIAAVVFDRVFYVCPHCGSYLHHNRGPKCSYCGREVNKSPYELEQVRKAEEERKREIERMKKETDE